MSRSLLAAALVGAGEREAPRELRELARDILAAAKSPGVEAVVLAGGSLAVRPDLPKLLRLITKVGLAPAVVVDGAELERAALREVLIAAGVVSVRAELAPGGDAAATSRGLEALARQGPAGLRLELAVTLTRSSLAALGDVIEALVAAEGRATLRLVAPTARVDEVEWPGAEAAAAAVSAALDRVAALDGALETCWEGLAPCLLDERYAALRDERLRWGALRFGPVEALGALAREAPGDRRHPAPCRDCAHRASCPGAPVVVLDRDGEAVLRPTVAVQANSFNYEHAEALGRLEPRAGDCRAVALELPDGPLRTVILVDEAGAAARYHTPTADFSDEQIAEVKDQLEQLYLDVSPEAALDDFTESVRRLRLHLECRRCPDRPRCCAAVTVDPEPPFFREERWLRKEVSRLRGRVLDLGCGELLYREELDDLLARGEIEYLGLDPDAGALERLRASGFTGRLEVGEVEGLEVRPGVFDYVLVFRSFNHFRDLARAFDVICRALRPGGQLVICDSPPFGLLRSAAQVAFADRQAAVGHEHYRNWTSHQVVELLERYPLRLDVHRPVSAKTSNQWILKYMRAN